MMIGALISRHARASISGPTPGARIALRVAAVACACWAGVAVGSTTSEDAVGEEQFALHGQLTYVEQETSSFHAPYAGANSLSPNEGRETFDATLYAGARLWSGAEAWINGEIDQGFGLDGTLGVAGFPSGEAYKVGRKQPYLRLPRAFVREVWSLDGEYSAVSADQNQLAGRVTSNRIVLTVGKFAVGDVFDTLRLAHDARSDFLNWSAIDSSTFDYAADAWGYTIGAALEYYVADWTLRGAVFDLSNVPNSPHLDPGAHEFQMVAELERRFDLSGAPGRALLTFYQSRGRMALLAAAIDQAQATGATPDVALARQYRSRSGIHLSVEQSLTENLGAYVRVGAASGDVEAYEFTDVDRALAVGAALQGVRWGRKSDIVGLAMLANRASAARQQYLAAGGLGILVGDGRLPNPGAEQIAEGYYRVGLGEHMHLTLDLQRIINPAFNHDRGPVSIFALRLHAAI